MVVVDVLLDLRTQLDRAGIPFAQLGMTHLYCYPTANRKTKISVLYDGVDYSFEKIIDGHCKGYGSTNSLQKILAHIINFYIKYEKPS